MGKNKKKIEEDEFAEFRDVEIADLPMKGKKAVEELSKGESAKVAFEFPPGFDPAAMEKIIAMAAKMTVEHARCRSLMEKSRKEYMVEGKRRWRCMVTTLRDGWDHFEMFISDPAKPDRPVKVMGKCGVILDDGLTKCVIDRLKYEHSFVMVEDPDIDLRATMILSYKSVKKPHYMVDVYEEIENPKKVGRVGPVTVAQA